jgi:hypothetical protein
MRRVFWSTKAAYPWKNSIERYRAVYRNRWVARHPLERILPSTTLLRALQLLSSAGGGASEPSAVIPG